MKYIDAEKLKEKIQPLYENAKMKAHFARETGTSSDCVKYDEAKSIYEHILWFIDTFQQEQPEVDFEEEAKKMILKLPFFIKGKDQIDFARHFFNLGFNLGLNSKNLK